MNANTALKINDAVHQAVRCGEAVEDIREQVNRALCTALQERHARELRALKADCERYYGARPGWLT